MQKTIIIKLLELGFSQTWLPKPAHPLLSYVPLDKLLNLFKPQFFHHKMEIS